MQPTETYPYSDEKWAVQDRTIGWRVLIDPIAQRRQIPRVPAGTSEGA